jgi:hypothetical protein
MSACRLDDSTGKALNLSCVARLKRTTPLKLSGRDRNDFRAG